MEPTPNQKVTIYTIAKEAGVSPATVSRVLTNSANVRPEKRERIEELIHKYNFMPSALARGLTDTRRMIIGIITADVRNSFYADVYTACENAASKAGYTMLLLNSFGDRDTEKRQIKKLLEQRVDAIIQLGGAADDVETDTGYAKQVKIAVKSLPFVVTGKVDGADCNIVRVDAERALELLVEHLVYNGNKRIALVGGRIDVVSTKAKYEHFLKIADKYHLDTNPVYLENWGGYRVDKGLRSMDALFDKCHKQGIPYPDAVIAVNDLTAVGVIKSIERHGLRIPEDIAVVGYDNIDIDEIIEPNITTIDYNYAVFGEMLVSTAIAGIEGTSVEKQRNIEPNIVIRESSDIKRV
ncbi:MAG: LacI family transcriptional regulator [Lachnospiraceae bacterium]|nr:LacI family transcriptional regulator [Lachnospiraceae bacterium]